MKLLMCRNCGDIYNLAYEPKTCGCKKTGGQYIDELNARYYGEAQPLGFDNLSFRFAYQMFRLKEKANPIKPDLPDSSICFEAFFISSNTSTLKKITKATFNKKQKHGDKS